MSKDYIWSQKYRPETLNEFAGNVVIRDKFKEYIDNNDIPNLLLTGKNGTGKTTLAKIIVKNIDCDYIYINASDENNIDTVRNKIKSFATSVGFKKLKVIILDEADYITINGQAALRNLMEVTSKNARFILTCNYYNKIIEPVISRCQTFDIKPIDKVDVAARIIHILDSESIKYDKKDVVFIINSFYPDIRKIINEMQKYSTNNVLKISEEKIIDSDYKLKILNILIGNDSKKKKFDSIRQIIANNSIVNFVELYKFLYDNIDELNYTPSDVILILAEHEYQDAFVVDKEITFCACIAQILNL